MAFLQLTELEWHQGEEEMQRLMHNPPLDNPTVPALSPQLANHLRVAPLVAIGILDKQNRPWTTLWGSEEALGGAVAQGIIGIRAPVTSKYDPVIEELFGDSASKQVIRPEGKGRMVSGVTIDLETRKRVKLFGRMVAGAIDHAVDEVTDTAESTAEAQLVLRIEQSLGNCPKYLNKKHIVKATANPKLLSASTQLSSEATELLAKADLFFITSRHDDEDMDTNHRGGPAGFMRLLQNDEDGAVLCWPEYSGNRFYQTLGNLKLNPVAGICVPDFETGDMLYLTGGTEILVSKAANDVLPRSNLVVKFTATAARFVAQALPFRGVPGESSPYNPAVRYHANEKKQIQTEERPRQATLVKQTKITPTISRYLFALERPAKYKSGQYVTFDFSSLLDIGYSHMRNDDPTSLNDDFVRTFTVSSSSDAGPKENEFEITIRHVGAVTKYMSKFQGSHASNRAPLEVAIKGFGGDFEVAHKSEHDRIMFIAAGIGITPLLPALHHLDLNRLRLLWSLRADDIGLAEEVLHQHPDLSKVTSIFVSNMPASSPSKERMQMQGVNLVTRRLAKEDVVVQPEESVYICAATPFRKLVTDWLPGRELIFEDFNF